MSVLWTFRCYVNPKGEDAVRAWYDAANAKVRGQFLSRLKTLAGLPMEEWHDNLHKHLHGCHPPISEIRFKADKIQWRPLGFHSGQNEYTILMVARKTNIFDPKSALKTAMSRRKEVEAGSITNALWLALE